MIVTTDSVLLALVSPVGYRSEWGALRGYVKVASGKDLIIESSELKLLDANGNTLEARPDAFGLLRGSHLAGPYSERFGDDKPRNPRAAYAAWRVNNLVVMTSLVELASLELRSK